jgi:hypothetical protein
MDRDEARVMAKLGSRRAPSRLSGWIREDPSGLTHSASVSEV